MAPGVSAAHPPRHRRARAAAGRPARRRSSPQRAAGGPACLLRWAPTGPFATRRASPPPHPRSPRPLRGARGDRGPSPSSGRHRRGPLGIAIVFALRLDVGLGRILGRGRFLTHRRRGRLDRQIAADGLHRQVTAPVADDDRPILAALANDAGGLVALEVAARGVVIAHARRAQEAHFDVATDRLEPAFAATGFGVEIDRDVAAHRVQLAGADPPADVDVATHRAAFDRPHVVGALHVAAHALEPHRPLHVGDVHVAGDALHACRTARAVQVEVPAHRLRVDRGLTWDGDLEIDPEALAPQQVEPGALLLVEVWLDEDVVALLLDADLDVLEQPLRSVGASTLHALGRDAP